MQGPKIAVSMQKKWKKICIHIYVCLDRNEHEKILSGFPDKVFSGPPP